MENFIYYDEGDTDTRVKWKNAPIIVEETRAAKKDPVFREISDYLLCEWHKWPGNEDIEKRLLDLTSPEQVELIITGVVNLTNTVLDHDREGKPIDTFVFMDKSARNLAYAFKEMWRRLKKEKIIKEEISLPSIRFINIDCDYLEVASTEIQMALLKERIRSSDYVGKKVVIVDEYVESGRTLRKAQETLFQMYGINPIRMSGLRGLPGWYGSKELGLLGVTDLEDQEGLYNDVKENLNTLPVENIVLVAKVARKLGREGFLQVVEDIRTPLETLAKKRCRYMTEEIKEVRKILRSVQMTPDDAICIWDFVDSAGELLARPLNDRVLESNGKKLRSILKMEVNKFVDLQLANGNN